MYSYQLTPIGAAMPGLFVSEEICAVSSANGGGFSFSVKGGKPRATISWMVTTVDLQPSSQADCGSEKGSSVDCGGGVGPEMTPVNSLSDLSSEDEGWGGGPQQTLRQRRPVL